jgi:hypothetical protein
VNREYADSVNWTNPPGKKLHGANSVLSIASSHNSAEAQKKMSNEPHKMSDIDLANLLDKALQEVRFRYYDKWSTLEKAAIMEIATKMNKIAWEGQKK